MDDHDSGVARMYNTNLSVYVQRTRVNSVTPPVIVIRYGGDVIDGKRLSA